MTDKQKRLRELLEQRSRERGRLSELAAKEELNDEERAEFDKIETGTADIERRCRQAQRDVDEETESAKVESRAADDGEAMEIRQLREKVTVQNYVVAAMERRAAYGAEAELNAALGIGGTQFPLDCLAPPMEERADTNVETQTTPRRWVDRLFAETAAMDLGITMETCEPGVASFPVTTAGASAAQRGRGEAHDDAAWTLSVTELKPKRNAVGLVFNSVDALRVPGLESALTRDLQMALTEGVDRAVFLGDAGADENVADITGLTTAASVVEVELTQANKVKGPETLDAFLGLVDGIHAGMLNDLRVVTAIGAYRLWERTIINTSAENQTLAAFLRMAGLTFGSRGEIETDTAANDWAAFVGRSRGIDGAGVACFWNKAELIRDPYSGANKGEVSLSLNTYWDFALPRATNFARVKFVA